MIGRRLFDVFPEARGSVFEENCARVLQTKTALSFEFEFAAPPHQNWYEIRIYPEKNGIAVFSQVITERKRAEAVLSESESHFRQLAEFLPQPAWICLPDGRCDYLSRQWVEFTGVPAAQQLDFGWLSQVCAGGPGRADSPRGKRRQRLARPSKSSSGSVTMVAITIGSTCAQLRCAMQRAGS